MCRFFKSSVGMKFAMALSGIALIGFVIAHLLGNLQIFFGPERLNAYGETLEELGPLLWVVRITLLIIFSLHIYLGFRLKIMNKNARPQGYEVNGTIQATLTSRTMIFTGMMILFFVIYHLLHYSLYKINPEFGSFMDAKGRHDVYRMMILGFSNRPVSLSYIIAMIFLAFHLHHGASSLFQSLGLTSDKYKKYTLCVGPVLSVFILLGYVSIPIAVMAGLVK